MSTENNSFTPANRGFIQVLGIGLLLAAAAWMLIQRLDSTPDVPLAKALEAKKSAAAERRKLEDQKVKEDEAFADLDQIFDNGDWRQLELNCLYVVKVADRVLTTLEEQSLLRTQLLQSDAADFVPQLEDDIRRLPLGDQHIAQRIQDATILRHKAQATVEQAQRILKLERITTPLNPETTEAVAKHLRLIDELAKDVDAEFAVLKRVMASKKVAGTKSGQTVGQLTAAWGNEEAEKYLAARQKAIAETRAKAEADRIEAQQELEAARTRAETERVRAEKELLDLKANSELEKLADQKREAAAAAEVEKLRLAAVASEKAADAAMEAAMPEIKKYLSQFMMKSNRQFRSDGYTDLSTEPAPISLTSLRAWGALKPGEGGCYKLKFAMGVLAEKGERVPAPIDVAAFDHANALPAQSLLVKHGDAMVRAGLLSP